MIECDARVPQHTQHLQALLSKPRTRCTLERQAGEEGGAELRCPWGIHRAGEPPTAPGQWEQDGGDKGGEPGSWWRGKESH